MKNLLEQAFQEAAHAADRAVRAAMQKYSNGLVTDEDDITGALIGRLDAAFDEKIGGITWSSSFSDTVGCRCTREESWCRHAVSRLNRNASAHLFKGGSDSVKEN
jgi:hypothetical protein